MMPIKPLSRWVETFFKTFFNVKTQHAYAMSVDTKSLSERRGVEAARWQANPLHTPKP